MRLISFVIFLVIGVSQPVAADQTDSRLDGLFEELRNGNAIKAEETVDRILGIWADAQSDTVDLLYERALVSANEGSYDLSVALLDHVIGLAPNFSQGYALRGLVRLRAENQEDAVADFSQVLALEPRQFEVRLALAEILLANGEKRDAYEMLQKVLEWNPHNEYARNQSRALRRELDGQEI